MAIQKLELAVVVTEDPKGFAETIGQTEVLRERVVALTDDTVSLRKQLEAHRAAQKALNDEINRAGSATGAQASQIQQMSLREKELEQNLQHATFAQRTARQELGNLHLGQQQANESARVLAAQLGINLPSSLVSLTNRIPAVRTAMDAAFNVAIAAGFAGAIVSLVIPALEKTYHWLTDLDAASQKLLDDVTKGNKEAIGKSADLLRTEVSGINKQIEALEAGKRARDAAASKAIAGGQGESVIGFEAAQLADEKKIKELEDKRLETNLKLNEVLGKQKDRTAELLKQTELVGLSETEKLRKQIGQASAGVIGEGGFASEKEKAAQVALLQAQLTEAMRKENEQRVKEHLAALNEMQKNSADWAAKQSALLDDELKAHQKSDAQWLDISAKTVEEDYQLHKKLVEDEIELSFRLGDAQVEALMKEMDVREEAAKKAKEAIEQQQQDIVGFLDRTVGAAHSAKEALANIWKEMANEWKHQIFEMIAASITGQRQATGVGTRGSGLGGGGGIGGVLGAILGAGLGIPATGAANTGAGSPSASSGPGGIAGVITNFGPTSGTGQQFQTITGGLAPGALDIGFGAVAPPGPSSTNAASAAGFPATMPLGDVFTSLGLSQKQSKQLGLAAFGGTVAAMGFQLNNPVARGLVTAAGLGLAGFEIGNMIVPGIGGLIGAGIGAAAGGIISLFGKDKKKLADTAIENQGFAQIKLILDDYSHHRRDYASAFDSMESVHQQMQQAFVRGASKRNEQMWFDRYIAQLQGIEDERNRRRELQAMLPVPEFSEGGSVQPWPWKKPAHYDDGGAVPAILHEGEFVMRRQAVDRIGMPALERLNRGEMNRGEMKGYAIGGFVGKVLAQHPQGLAQWVETSTEQLRQSVSKMIIERLPAAPAAGKDSGGGALRIEIDPDGEKWLLAHLDGLEKGLAVILRGGGKVSRALRS